MPNRPLRSFLATLVVVGSAVPGFIGASASAVPAEAVAPGGGCWRYIPGLVAAPDADITDVTGMTDLSVALEQWAVDPRLTLGTAGDTVVGGVRTFSLELAGGPAVQSRLTAVPGTATYFFDVLDPAAGRTALDPIEVDFDIAANAEAIPAMRADGSFPLALAGTSALILRAAYFDLPSIGERLACNGQTEGNPTTNPARTPLDTSVLAPVTSVSSTGIAVGRVVGQQVVTAARAGDEVELALSGFASEIKVPLGFCGPVAGAAPVCRQAAEATTLPNGSAATTLVVPQDAVIGAGTIRAQARIGAADVVLEQPLRVLDEPGLELGKISGRNRLRAIGAEWNPLQEVRVKAIDEAGDRVGKTVSVEAGSTGQIDARLSVPADAEVVAIVAEQSHRGATLEATVDVPVSDAEGGSDDAGGNADTSTDSNDGTNTSGAPPAAAPVAPVDIPAPVDLPVTTVADPQSPGAANGADALAVTKVTLAGSTRFSDLFGGGPERVLELQVENVGAVEAVAPGLSIAVGKGDETDPVYASDGFARLAPGESLKVEIPIGLPAGAFGVYTINGQIGGGESGAFAITWENYPWGLFGLNGLGILLIAFAVRRRIFAPAPSRIAALIGAPGGAVATSGSDAGAAVIDLAVLERWWALQADGDDARNAVGAEPTADAVVDVDAVERWLERCSARSAEIGPNSAPSTSSSN